MSLTYLNYASISESYIDCENKFNSMTVNWLTEMTLPWFDWFDFHRVPRQQLGWTVDLFPGATIICFAIIPLSHFAINYWNKLKMNTNCFNFSFAYQRRFMSQFSVKRSRTKKQLGPVGCKISFNNLSNVVHNTSQPCKTRDLKGSLLQ